MADNQQLPPSTPFASATKELAGVHHQRVVVQHGGPGVAVDTSSAAPLPVADANAALSSTALGAPDDTEATGDGSVVGLLKRIRTLLTAVRDRLPSSLVGGRLDVHVGASTTLAVAHDGLTDAELRASPVSVSGPLTDAQMRATPVPVSGTVSTGALTDAQLRASAVPVSGPLTDTQMRASAVLVSAAALPLPAGASENATVAAGNALLSTIDADTSLLVSRTPPLLSTIPTDLTAAVPVRPVPVDLWRVSFADTGSGVPSAEVTLSQTGAGHTVSQSTGNLVIATGTTANAETVIRSNRTFRGAHILRYRLQLSQRIASQFFEIALADTIGEDLAYTINSATSVTVTFPSVNPFTTLSVGQFVNLGQLSSVGVPGRYAIASVSGLTVTFTVAGWPATGSGTMLLWGHNYHRIAYSGTTATNASYDAQRRGWANGDTTVTISTTAGPGHVGHLQSMGQMAGYADSLTTSNAAYQFTPRASRLENLPDDTTELHLFIVARNGASAPASTTTLTIAFVSVEMTGRQKVYLSGGDQMGAPMSPSVQVANFPATQAVSLATNTPTLAAGTNLAGDVGLQARANATGAATPSPVNSPATPAAQTHKGTAGRVLGWTLHNAASSLRFVKLFNVAAPTLGTTAALYEIAIPAGGSVEISYPVGIAHGTAIVTAVTSARGLTDNTATGLAATDITGHLLFA
jgi:hypothetical protein